MNFDVILSKNNERIKKVHRLVGSPSERADMGLFVLEGLRLCRDAAQNAVESEELYFTDSVYKKFTADIDFMIERSKLSFCVSEDAFKKISDTDNSQGVCAVYNKSKLNTDTDLTSSCRYIACENVSDPGNLGAISRTAEALGINGLILLGSCCDMLNPKALRASMGALIRIPVVIYKDAVSAIELMKAQGFRVLASVVTADATPISEVKFGDGDIIIIGNEANGIKPETAAVCNECITIPIKGRAESFNAAAAASILMWELAK